MENSNPSDSKYLLNIPKNPTHGPITRIPTTIITSRWFSLISTRPIETYIVKLNVMLENGKTLVPNTEDAGDARGNRNDTDGESGIGAVVEFMRGDETIVNEEIDLVILVDVFDEVLIKVLIGLVPVNKLVIRLP